jgi:hypothetical protein
MKKLHALWIGSLIVAPLGCTSHHEKGSEGREGSQREEMEEGEENEENEKGEGTEEDERVEHQEASAERQLEGHGEGLEGKLSLSVVGFGEDAVGSLPAGWRIEGTNQKGPLATWKVVADETAPGRPNVLALTSPNHDSGGTFNLCWTEKTRFQNGALEVSLKPVSGKEDQGGGLIWRAKDKDNYYICRANPLENNFRVYYVKDASRHQLASANVEIATGKWHTIRIEHEGDHIACSLDGKKLLDVRDSTLPGEGGIGLWTKSDAASEFDDLKLTNRASADNDEDEDEENEVTGKH